MKILLSLLSTVGLTGSTVVAVDNTKETVSDVNSLNSSLVLAKGAVAVKKTNYNAIAETNAKVIGKKITITPLENSKLLEGQFVNVSSAEATKKPVIINPGPQTLKAGELSKGFTIEILNEVSGKFLTAKSSNVGVAIVEVELFNVLQITPVATGISEVTLSYDGADDVKFTVTVSPAIT